MKRILNRFLSVIAGISLLISCAPDEFFLGSVDVKPSDLVPGIAFKIEPDAQNPNIIHLRSLMDKKVYPIVGSSPR